MRRRRRCWTGCGEGRGVVVVDVTLLLLYVVVGVEVSCGCCSAGTAAPFVLATSRGGAAAPAAVVLVDAPPVEAGAVGSYSGVRCQGRLRGGEVAGGGEGTYEATKPYCSSIMRWTSCRGLCCSLYSLMMVALCSFHFFVIVTLLHGGRVCRGLRVGIGLLSRAAAPLMRRGQRRGR